MSATQGLCHPEGNEQRGRQVASRRQIFLLAIVLLIISLAAVSSGSLWIDEGLSAYHALAPSVSLLWESLLAEQNSNLQLPLYHYYLWVWAQVFGTSEFALRAANIPLVFLVYGAFVYLLKEHWWMLFFSVLVLGTNAMFWAYMDESRPYLMILGAFSWAMAAALRPILVQNKVSSRLEDGSNTCILLLSLLWLSACSMIALPWCLTCFIAWFMGVRKGICECLVKVWPVALTCLFLLGGILAYYAWTIALDARASPGETNILTMAFCVYENLGFSGFGPSRQDLRIEAGVALVSYAGTLLLPTTATLLSCGLIIKALANPFGHCRKLFPPLFVMGGAFFIIQSLGMIEGVRILGRHVIPILAIWSVALGTAFGEIWTSPVRVACKGVIPLVLIVFLSSSLLYRFSGTHEKDNYREAARWARMKAMAGKKVLWAADVPTARYYKVGEELEGVGQILLMGKGKPADYGNLDAIVLSRPDIYDHEGEIREAIAKHGLVLRRELRSFSLYLKQDNE